MSCAIEFHQFLLSIAWIASIFSLIGGGLVLPPFKSLYWFQTDSSFVGLYGGCPKTPNAPLIQIDSNWQELQTKCWYFFDNAASPIPGTLGKLESEVLFIADAISALLIFSSLLLFGWNDIKSSAVISLVSFVIPSAAFGFAVFYFVVTAGQFTDTTNNWTFWTQFFGPGLYLSGSACILILISACLGLHVNYGRETSRSFYKQENMEMI